VCDGCDHDFLGVVYPASKGVPLTVLIGCGVVAKIIKMCFMLGLGEELKYDLGKHHCMFSEV